MSGMAYTDYEFYTTAYFGNTIPETSFEKYADRATDELDAITFCNVPSISDLPEALQKKVKKAMCSLADTMYNIDQQLQRANSTDMTNVKSKSSGSESVSYGQSETILTKAAADPAFRSRLYYDAVKTYLSGTGFLYAGC